MVAAAPAAPEATVRLSLIVILAADAAMARAPTTGLAGEPGAEATSMLAKKSKNYNAKSPPRRATTTASPPSLHDFATYFSQRNSNL
jgi:hypothetical protein